MNAKQLFRTIFTFSITLCLAFGQLHAGMISKVSRITDGKKNIVFFSDIHSGSDYVGNRRIEVVDGAHKQIDGMELFFDQLLTTTPEQVDVLIECRDGLKGLIRSAGKQRTDFEGYFKRFYAHLAQGQQLDRDLLQRINLENIDSRTELDSHIDHLLDRFAPLFKRIAKGYKFDCLISYLYRVQFEMLDKNKNRAIKKIIANRRYQAEKQQEIDHFNALVANRDWFAQNKKMFEGYLQTIKRHVPQEFYAQLYDSVQQELQKIEEIVATFERYAQQNGQSGILAGMYAWLESPEGSFAKLYDHVWALFYNDVMKVDFYILQKALASQAPWVLVHVGGYHVHNIMQQLRKLDLYIDEIDVLASQKYLQKNYLADELQTLLDVPEVDTEVKLMQKVQDPVDVDKPLVQQLQDDYMQGHTTTVWSWVMRKVNRVLDWICSLFS